jgi:D-3-phosphoglycerate dehydrogenase
MPEVFAPLEALGMTVEINPTPYPMEQDALIAFIGDAWAAVIGAEYVTEEVMEACPGLRMVARTGVGFDRVDLDAATRRGIVVTNTPGANSTAVAELTLGMLLALIRHVVPGHNGVQKGIWRRLMGSQLSDKTLGIIGLGNVGKKVAPRAQAFEMDVIANDIEPDHEFAAAHGIPFVSKEEIYARSDFVTLHTPLTSLTHHLINRETLAAMKPGAFLVNAARGPIVDPEALAEALDSGHIAGAALDVHTVDGYADDCMLGRDNVITTAHVGAATHEALRNTTESVVESIAAVAQGRRPVPVVNAEVWPEQEEET